MSIGLDEDFFSETDWLNECDAAFGTIALGLFPSLRYLSRFIEDPKELWSRLDRTFGMIDEDHHRNLEKKSSTIIILDPKFSASTLSDEFVQDEEEAASSTQSIRIEDSLYAVTPSPDAPEVHEIFDISSSHIAETEEDIRISNIEEKYCCTSMQTFTHDFPLNSVQNFKLQEI